LWGYHGRDRIDTKIGILTGTHKMMNKKQLAAASGEFTGRPQVVDDQSVM
jgi:hypothetical protein